MNDGSYSISVTGFNCPDVEAIRNAYTKFVEEIQVMGGTVTASFLPAESEPTATEATAAAQTE